MNAKQPLISVLMTVYNTETYLREAIDSILRQDFTNFEFIIINDGSTDNSQEIIDEYAQRDKRIITVHQKNSGLVYSLNKGIGLAKGTYIARMDADDVCMDNRLSAQAAFMEAHPEVILLGGGFEIMDEDGWYMGTVHAPTTDEDIRRTMMLRNPFGHASVIFRKEAAIKAGLYSADCGPTEDYEFWIRMRHFGKLAALPAPLYRYRINSAGISASKAKIQDHYRLQHLAKLWNEEGRLTVLGRRELRARSAFYLHASKRMSYGIGMRLQFLQDNAQLGIKMIRYGHVLMGMRQLFSVAIAGRSGLGVVRSRLLILVRNSPKSAAKIIRGHKEQLENVDIPTT